MRTIKPYSKRAPFYNAFVGTNPTGELINSGLSVIRQKNSIGVIAQGFRRAYNHAHHGNS
jgi:hypothetical protein